MRNLHELPLEKLDQAQTDLEELKRELAPDNQVLALLLTDLMEAVAKECLARTVGQEAAIQMYRELHTDA